MSELTLADLSRMIGAAVKDKSYASTPLGLEVRRYYRWKKNEWGATAETMRDYEAILAKLAVFHAASELAAFTPPAGTDLLREAWDHYWGEASPRTRRKVRSVWVDFFDWCQRERDLPGNPARGLASPKQRDVERETFTQTFVDEVIAAQTYLPDKIGCRLILHYGLRRGGVAKIQFKHFDFERKLLTVFTKGGRVHPLPIVEDELWRDLAAAQLEHRLGPNDYLITYKTDTRTRRVDLDGAQWVEEFPGPRGTVDRVGYAKVTNRKHDQEPTGKRMHLWWYRCLERAGIVGKGVTAGQNMHRGRHTAITELLRSSHNLELARMLAGHKDIRTTAMYAHLDTGDLEAALRELRGDD